MGFCAKPMPGSRQIFSELHARLACRSASRLAVNRRDLGHGRPHNVVVILHRLRSATHMHGADPRAALCTASGSMRGSASRPVTSLMISAPASSAAWRRSPLMVRNRKSDAALPGHLFHHGSTRRNSSSGRDGMSVVRSGTFAANVKNLGPFRRELEWLAPTARAIVEPAAIGKAVGRYVTQSPSTMATARSSTCASGVATS